MLLLLSFLLFTREVPSLSVNLRASSTFWGYREKYAREKHAREDATAGRQRRPARRRFLLPLLHAGSNTRNLANLNQQSMTTRKYNWEKDSHSSLLDLIPEVDFTGTIYSSNKQKRKIKLKLPDNRATETCKDKRRISLPLDFRSLYYLREKITLKVYSKSLHFP